MMSDHNATNDAVDSAPVSDWHKLYGEKYTEISAESFSHPAKMAKKLVFRIVQHCIDEGWLRPGDTVLDPFGGIGTTALPLMKSGINFVGVELEPRFQRLGQGMNCPGLTKAAWRRYNGRGKRWNDLDICPDCGKLLDEPGSITEFFGAKRRAIPVVEAHRYHGNIECWSEYYPGHAVLLQGDSRNLSAVLSGAAEGSISSPPYADSVSNHAPDVADNRDFSKKLSKMDLEGRHYSDNPSNLGNLPATPAGLDGAIASPPYADSINSARNGIDLSLAADPSDRRERHDHSNVAVEQRYGQTPGQLGSMKAGDLDLALISPPYADIAQSGGTRGLVEHGTGLTQGERCFDEYGAEPGNLGRMPSTPAGLDMALSSPPYAEGLGHGMRKEGQIDIDKGLHGAAGSLAYGESEGQLASMRNSEEGYDGAISSPPYAECLGHDAQAVRLDKAEDERRKNEGTARRPPYGYTSGQLGAMKADDLDGAISSPPYAEARIGQTSGQEQCGHNDAYGAEEGQLGVVKAMGYDGAVSSPPFGATQTGGGIAMDGYHNEEKRKGVFDLVGKRSYTPENQGVTPGNLASMDANISSPPFEGVTPTEGDPNYSWKFHGDQSKYGDTDGNIGNEAGQDFWTAARTIVDQVYAVLRPGAHAVWVTKAFVKNKAIVDFPGQWQRMCEAAGFRTVHIHRAWLIEERGTQLDLEGNGHKKVVARKSFFRRLCESKGSPAIDWETVICMVKP